MGRRLSQLPLLSSFGISGLGSHFGLALETLVFRWAGLFLGPNEWAFEPYFSNPINNNKDGKNGYLYSFISSNNAALLIGKHVDEIHGIMQGYFGHFAKKLP